MSRFSTGKWDFQRKAEKRDMSERGDANRTLFLLETWEVRGTGLGRTWMIQPACPSVHVNAALWLASQYRALPILCFLWDRGWDVLCSCRFVGRPLTGVQQPSHNAGVKTLRDISPGRLSESLIGRFCHNFASIVGHPCNVLAGGHQTTNICNRKPE